MNGGEYRAVARDGVSLGLWRIPPRAAVPRATPILLVHGTFSTRDFFGGPGGLGAELAARGFDVWVGELRGLDRSEHAERERWDFEDWIVRDAPALIGAVRVNTGADQVLWIGHSAGAVIGAGAAARFPDVAGGLAGLALVAAPAPDRPGVCNAVVSLAGLLITRIVGRLPANALGIGPADEGPRILSQWCGWILKRRWTGRDGFDYMARAGQFMGPALAVAGAADLLTPPSTCRRLLEALGSTDRTMIVCGKRQGFSENYTHNRVLISRAARQEVWPRIAGWLEERF